jgi:hypothetical protein
MSIERNLEGAGFGCEGGPNPRVGAASSREQVAPRWCSYHRFDAGGSHQDGAPTVNQISGRSGFQPRQIYSGAIWK